MLPLLNIHKLQDKDLVVFNDGDVEIKINSNSPHRIRIHPQINKINKVSKALVNRPFTHQIYNEKYKCFIVKTTDTQYKDFI